MLISQGKNILGSHPGDDNDCHSPKGGRMGPEIIPELTLVCLPL